MRLLLYNPNSDAGLTLRLSQAISLLLDREDTIGVATAERGPRFIGSAEAIALAREILMAELAEKARDYDAIILGCFGDLGIEPIRRTVDKPILSLWDACLTTLAPLSDKRFGIITTSSFWVDRLQSDISRRGLSHCIRGRPRYLALSADLVRCAWTGHGSGAPRIGYRKHRCRCGDTWRGVSRRAGASSDCERIAADLRQSSRCRESVPSFGSHGTRVVRARRDGKPALGWLSGAAWDELARALKRVPGAQANPRLPGDVAHGFRQSLQARSHGLTDSIQFWSRHRRSLRGCAVSLPKTGSAARVCAGKKNYIRRYVHPSPSPASVSGRSPAPNLCR